MLSVIFIGMIYATIHHMPLDKNAQLEIQAAALLISAACQTSSYACILIYN